MGAIGIYWARPHRAAPRRGVQLLQALADSTAVLDNVRILSGRGSRPRLTADLEAANRQLERTNGDLLAAQHQADRASRPIRGRCGNRARGQVPARRGAWPEGSGSSSAAAT